jgi:hypothetical protein
MFTDPETGSTSASGRSLAVLTAELRATSREIEDVLGAHRSAYLMDGEYGEDTGHDDLTREITDFVKEFDIRERDFRRKAEETADGLVMAAYCYEHTDSWIAELYLNMLGGS